MSQLMYYDTTSSQWLPIVVGAQGVQGVQGLGYAQLQGVQGATGLQGRQGTIGIQGTTGTQGLLGNQGTTGTQGIIGQTGLQGLIGLQGNAGTDGANGAQGTTGTQGLTGIQGTTGTQGLTGLQGFTGLQGSLGAGLLVGIQSVGTTTYTLQASDLNKFVTLNNASSITLTIPPSVFSANDQIHVQQIGTGQTTFATGSGVTVTSAAAVVAAPKLRAQYSGASVICTVGGATPSFTVLGDIS